MLNEDQLLKLGYEIKEDPDQPGWFCWINGAGGSEISYDSREAAILEAGQDAFAVHGELHQCDNCGAVHETEDLLPARHLSQRVEAGGVMPSGECPECRALCYPIEEAPDWETVRDYFGLDHSFQYGAGDMRDYTLRYLESIAAQDHEAEAGKKAIELLAQADSYLRDIRAENLDGSEPALGELLEQITTFWIESGVVRHHRDFNAQAPAQDEIPVGKTGKLVTLDGEEVIGALESVAGTAGLISATRNADGSLELDYDGDTDMDWDSQVGRRNDAGELLFVTLTDRVVPQSQVKLVAEDD